MKSNITGGNAPGIEAEANRIFRKSSSDSGVPMLAICPIFHITGVPASILVVPINSQRPFLLYSCATFCKNSALMYFEIKRKRGEVSASPSLKIPARKLRALNTSEGLISV